MGVQWQPPFSVHKASGGRSPWHIVDANNNVDAMGYRSRVTAVEAIPAFAAGIEAANKTRRDRVAEQAADNWRALLAAERALFAREKGGAA